MMAIVQYYPVDGCEECELNIEVMGKAAAGACNECILYGEAKKVEQDGEIEQ